MRNGVSIGAMGMRCIVHRPISLSDITLCYVYMTTCFMRMNSTKMDTQTQTENEKSDPP